MTTPVVVETPAAAPVVAPVVAPIVATRPDNVPEKFWDATKGAVNQDALLQSYTELEKKNSAAKPAEPVVPEMTEGEAAEHDATNKAAEAALKHVGLDLNTFTDEFSKDGKLSDASYETLAKAGFPKDFVDGHIEATLALGESITNAGYEAAGGKESYGVLTQWALQNIDPADIETFNEKMTGNKAQVVKAIKTLRDAYESATGKEPALLQAAGTSNSGDVFRSQAEVNVAIKDKRWGSDPAYTADITAKINRSTY